ncbi:MAG TPA: DUF2066 domain-containing protein [Alphaproteobacteria bacterium]|nr:DUF2066 domain-containing protein [Alphaproteobacteria bacterium]
MALFPKACLRLGRIALALLIASPVLLASSAFAADEVFTVANVPVDATAATAAQARERALQEGQRRAFQHLLQRLTPASERGRLPQPSDTVIADLVRDFEIAGEKTSTVRYIAALTVRFQPDDIRALLHQSGVPFSETPSKPVLVLPIVESSQGQVLSETTDWYAAWAKFVPGDGLVPFILPGNADEVAAVIPPNQASAANQRVLTDLANRSGAGSVLVAVAREHPGANGQVAADVSAVRFGAGVGEETFVAPFAPQAGDSTPTAALDRAVIATTGQIEESWKKSSLLRFDSSLRSIAARVPLGDMGALVAVERGLDGLAPIRRVDILRIGRDEAEIRLSFIGDEDQLKLLLAQRDLSLRSDGAGYVLTPAGKLPGAAR